MNAGDSRRHPPVFRGGSRRRTYTFRVKKRIALLGATGSIGRQALEVVGPIPASSSSRRPPARGRRRARAADPGRRRPHRAARARAARPRPQRVVGFAGLPATMWALEHGVDLALANKESLVAAGDLALAAQERGGGTLIPVDSEHSALFQCSRVAPRRRSTHSSSPRAAGRSAAARATSSPTSRRSRRSRTRRGTWARRSRSTRRRSRTRASR